MAEIKIGRQRLEDKDNRKEQNSRTEKSSRKIEWEYIRTIRVHDNRQASFFFEEFRNRFRRRTSKGTAKQYQFKAAAEKGHIISYIIEL